MRDCLQLKRLAIIFKIKVMLEFARDAKPIDRSDRAGVPLTVLISFKWGQKLLIESVKFLLRLFILIFLI